MHPRHRGLLLQKPSFWVEGALSHRCVLLVLCMTRKAKGRAGWWEGPRQSAGAGKCPMQSYMHPLTLCCSPVLLLPSGGCSQLVRKSCRKTRSLLCAILGWTVLGLLYMDALWFQKCVLTQSKSPVALGSTDGECNDLETQASHRNPRFLMLK